MKAKGKDLVFISWILRDGSGTEMVTDQDRIGYLKEEQFKLMRLSISEDTYIASGFNSYVVRLKSLWKTNDHFHPPILHSATQ